jgi:tetratricopeptide (TPR) repeat protein
MRYILTMVLLLIPLVLSCSRDANKPAAPAPEQKTDIQILREKIQNNPQDAEALYHLAELYDRAGLYQEEIDTLGKIVAIKPDLGYAYFKRGTACNRIERYQEAVVNFTKAAKLIPNQPMVLNNLAFSYGKLGRTDQEIASLKKALAMRPGYNIARFNLGMAYLKAGQQKEALQQYTLLKDRDEGYAAALKKEIDSKRR